MKKTFNRGIFSIPYIVIALLFVIAPLIVLLVRSFFDVHGNFTLNGFKVLTDITNIKVLLRSLGIAALNTIICLLLAYPLAYVLASAQFNKYAMFLLLFIAPMWINFLLRTYALKTLFGIVGLRDGFLAMMIGMVYDFFPFMLLPVYTVLANMDKSYKEAGRDLGAHPIKVFIKIILPLSMPGVVSGILMTFMPTISAFAIAQMLGGTTFIFGDLINNYFNFMSTWSAGAALAFVMLLLVLFSVVLSKLLTRKKISVRPASLGARLK